jgi:hypothetical protein
MMPKQKRGILYVEAQEKRGIAHYFRQSSGISNAVKTTIHENYPSLKVGTVITLGEVTISFCCSAL